MRAFFEFLDDAVDNNWRLTNEHLAKLLQRNIQEIKDSDSWFFAGYDFNKIRINLGEEAKEEWWKVGYFEENQKGVTCLGQELKQD